jgi:hypothetical protein
LASAKLMMTGIRSHSKVLLIDVYCSSPLIPAQAEIQRFAKDWVPASAGTIGTRDRAGAQMKWIKP